MRIALLAGLSALFFISCSSSSMSDQVDTETADSVDVHTVARPWEAHVTHLDWKATVDFEQQQLRGTATWKVNDDRTGDSIWFDTEGLTIEGVTANGQELGYVLGESNAWMGAPLGIALPDGVNELSIAYATTPGAKALQWLNPQQTYGKEVPFLFTQSQAILARSWIPCQDGPGIRYTYNAEVTVPKGMLALMSASNPTSVDSSGTYRFEMPQPIPSYLMALAVGNIEFAEVGPHTGLYAEPGVLPKAQYEFADMEKMLQEAEKLYGPYRWGRYDLIVLPPSFPFGGMENPRLTFCTPSVLAGDRSLTTIVAHELAHSWSGNLVTNATWNDFWLNEGFTVYFERRIMEALYGKDYVDIWAVLGYQDLEHSVAELPERDTWLKLDLEGRNPDDGLTDVAYEKGYFFLRLIEDTYGRESFDKFLRNYFDQHAFETMTTARFLLELDSNLLASDSIKRQSIQVDSWVYGPGIPNNCPKPKSSRLQAVSSTLKAWSDGTFTLDELDVTEWSPLEWLHFVRLLPDTLHKDRLAELDKAFAFTQSTNSEIQAAWYAHCIREDYEPAYPAIESFLVQIGRRKFLVPLYKALVEHGQAERARSIYQKARPNYHSVSTETIDQLLAERTP